MLINLIFRMKLLNLANSGLSYTNLIRHHASSLQKLWIHVFWSTSFTTISMILNLYSSLSWRLAPNFWLWILKLRSLSTAIRCQPQPLTAHFIYIPIDPFFDFSSTSRHSGSTPLCRVQPPSYLVVLLIILSFSPPRPLVLCTLQASSSSNISHT